jgi:hypothetical protein
MRPRKHSLGEGNNSVWDLTCFLFENSKENFLPAWKSLIATTLGQLPEHLSPDEEEDDGRGR